MNSCTTNITLINDTDKEENNTIIPLQVDTPFPSVDENPKYLNWSSAEKTAFAYNEGNIVEYTYLSLDNNFKGWCISDDSFFAMGLPYEKSYNHKNYESYSASGFLAPWIPLFALPEDSGNLILSRVIDNQEEVWVEKKTEIPDGGVYIFRVNQEKWVEISRTVVDNENLQVSVNDIFMLPNGEIWAFNTWNWEAIETNLPPYPLLSRFDNESYSFEIVYFEEKLLDEFYLSIRENYQSHYGEYFTLSDDYLVDYDKNGVWLLMSDEGIYYFNLDSIVIEKKIDLTGINILVNSAYMGPNGTIYFGCTGEYRSFDDKNLREGDLWSFDQTQNKLTSIPTPSEFFPYFHSLAIDKLGRLWLDDVGWLTSQGEWQRSYPENFNFEEFLSFEVTDFNGRGQRIIHVSSNGWIWYEQPYTSQTPGLGWLDPITSESCWYFYEPVGSYTTDIVSSEDNVWLAYDNILYQFPLAYQ